MKTPAYSVFWLFLSYKWSPFYCLWGPFTRKKMQLILLITHHLATVIFWNFSFLFSPTVRILQDLDFSILAARLSFHQCHNFFPFSVIQFYIWWCQKNHQWATWSSRALDKNLHNTKAKDLKRSTGVVPAKYPPTVKLEKSLVHNSRMLEG